jgi:hypothetical protein
MTIDSARAVRAPLIAPFAPGETGAASSGVHAAATDQPL